MSPQEQGGLVLTAESAEHFSLQEAMQAADFGGRLVFGGHKRLDGLAEGGSPLGEIMTCLINLVQLGLVEMQLGDYAIQLLVLFLALFLVQSASELCAFFILHSARTQYETVVEVEEAALPSRRPQKVALDCWQQSVYQSFHQLVHHRSLLSCIPRGSGPKTVHRPIQGRLGRHIVNLNDVLAQLLGRELALMVVHRGRQGLRLYKGVETGTLGLVLRQLGLQIVSLRFSSSEYLSL